MRARVYLLWRRWILFADLHSSYALALSPQVPSAHAIDREYRVMKALGSAGVPVPECIWLWDPGKLDRERIQRLYRIADQSDRNSFIAHLRSSETRYRAHGGNPGCACVSVGVGLVLGITGSTSE